MRGEERPASRSGSDRRRVAIVALIFAALVVVTAGAAAGGGPESRQFQLPKIAGLVEVVVVAAVPLALVLYILALFQRPTRRRASSTTRSFVATLVLLLAVVGLALIFRDELRLLPDPPAETDVAGVGAADDESEEDPVPEASGTELAVLIGVLGVGALLAVLVARRLAAQPSQSSGQDEDVTVPLGEVLDDAIASLRAEVDSRRAVIAAYAHMEQTLGHHGLPRHRSEAPLEYLERVLSRLAVSRPAATELTALFELALFSTHDFDRDKQDGAIAALVTVRDELRGKAAVTMAGP